MITGIHTFIQVALALASSPTSSTPSETWKHEHRETEEQDYRGVEHTDSGIVESGEYRFLDFPIVSRFSDDRYVNPNNFLDTDKHTDIYFDHFLPVYTVCEAIFFFGTYPAEFALLLLHYPICKNILIVGKFWIW